MPAKPTDGLLVNKAQQEQVGGSYFSHAEQRIETLARQGAKKTADIEPKTVWDLTAIGGLVLTGLGVIFAFFN
jgi:hypothetical protein